MKKILTLRWVLFLFAFLGISMVAVQGAVRKKSEFKVPKGFERESNFLPGVMPQQYYSKGDKKISIVIPPEYKMSRGAPITQSGKLHPDFINGKNKSARFFGFKNWKIEKYSINNIKNMTRLEVMGSYQSIDGKKNTFIEHHYFSKKNRERTISLIFTDGANKKLLNEAKLSMNQFNPNFE
ncbi:MAG: hypothetical protein KDD45_14800 [Bdellovibrionales bacterium]|nr:hypothetical protein [Bdellovibrionales bacterium]